MLVPQKMALSLMVLVIALMSCGRPSSTNEDVTLPPQPYLSTSALVAEPGQKLGLDVFVEDNRVAAEDITWEIEGDAVVLEGNTLVATRVGSAAVSAIVSGQRSPVTQVFVAALTPETTLVESKQFTEVLMEASTEVVGPGSPFILRMNGEVPNNGILLPTGDRFPACRITSTKQVGGSSEVQCIFPEIGDVYEDLSLEGAPVETTRQFTAETLEARQSALSAGVCEYNGGFLSAGLKADINIDVSGLLMDLSLSDGTLRVRGPVSIELKSGMEVTGGPKGTVTCRLGFPPAIPLKTIPGFGRISLDLGVAFAVTGELQGGKLFFDFSGKQPIDVDLGIVDGEDVRAEFSREPIEWEYDAGFNGLTDGKASAEIKGYLSAIIRADTGLFFGPKGLRQELIEGKLGLTSNAQAATVETQLSDPTFRSDITVGAFVEASIPLFENEYLGGLFDVQSTPSIGAKQTLYTPLATASTYEVDFVGSTLDVTIDGDFLPGTAFELWQQASDGSWSKVEDYIKSSEPLVISRELEASDTIGFITKSKGYPRGFPYEIMKNSIRKKGVKREKVLYITLPSYEDSNDNVVPSSLISFDPNSGFVSTFHSLTSPSWSDQGQRFVDLACDNDVELYALYEDVSMYPSTRDGSFGNYYRGDIRLTMISPEVKDFGFVSSPSMLEMEMEGEGIDGYGFLGHLSICGGVFYAVIPPVEQDTLLQYNQENGDVSVRKIGHIIRYSEVASFSLDKEQSRLNDKRLLYQGSESEFPASGRSPSSYGLVDLVSTGPLFSDLYCLEDNAYVTYSAGEYTVIDNDMGSRSVRHTSEHLTVVNIKQEGASPSRELLNMRPTDSQIRGDFGDLLTSMEYCGGYFYASTTSRGDYVGDGDKISTLWMFDVDFQNKMRLHDTDPGHVIVDMSCLNDVLYGVYSKFGGGDEAEEVGVLGLTPEVENLGVILDYSKNNYRVVDHQDWLFSVNVTSCEQQPAP